jgi:hypothetical protein
VAPLGRLNMAQQPAEKVKKGLVCRAFVWLTGTSHHTVPYFRETGRAGFPMVSIGNPALPGSW